MDKNKKNVPKIRFPEFTDPWEQRKFSDITYLAGEKNRDNISYQSYSISNERGFIPQDEQFENGGTMKEADKSMYLIVQPNSFAYNPARINVGSIGYYDLPENVIVSSLYEVFKTSGDIDDRFLWHWFKSDLFPKFIERYQEGGVRMYFYYNKLCMCSLNLSDIEEQIKIGKYFNKLDNLITLHQRKLEHLQDKNKGLLQKMFPKEGEKFPELRFHEFTDTWEQRKLGEVGETFTGLSGKTKDDFGHGDGRFVTYMNVFSNPVSDLNGVGVIEIDSKQSEVIYGDVLFTTSSETPHEVGMSSVWLENSANTYLNSFCFGYRPTEKFDPYYLAYMLRSPSIRDKFKLLAQGISRYNISKNKTMEMEIYIPSNAEQKLVGNFFRNLDNLITLHKRKLEHLQQQKKGLLQQMFI